MPLPLMNHSALALFAQRTRIPTSARSIGICVIWVCISSSSSSLCSLVYWHYNDKEMGCGLLFQEQLLGYQLPAVTLTRARAVHLIIYSILVKCDLKRPLRRFYALCEDARIRDGTQRHTIDGQNGVANV